MFDDKRFKAEVCRRTIPFTLRGQADFNLGGEFLKECFRYVPDRIWKVKYPTDPCGRSLVESPF